MTADSPAELAAGCATSIRVVNRAGSSWVRTYAWEPVDDPLNVAVQVLAGLLRRGACGLFAAIRR